MTATIPWTLTWWWSNPDDPWLAQLVMIGVTLLIVTPRKDREVTERRLQAVSRGGRLATWVRDSAPQSSRSV